MQTTHAPMLPSLIEGWREQGWPLVDLAAFRMEDGGGAGAGGGDGGGAGDGDGTGSGDGGGDGGAGDGTSKTPAELQAEVDKWKALSRKNEGEAKTNRAAAQKLAELEESQKTEEQKREERTAAAEAKATATELRAARLEVALEKGLPKELATRLQGSTKEEMEADADELLKLVKSDGNGRTADLGQGARGGAGGDANDMNSILRRAAGRTA